MKKALSQEKFMLIAAKKQMVKEEKLFYPIHNTAVEARLPIAGTKRVLI